MATYVNDLRLKEIGTGESSGTWGSETNTNLELIAEAFSYSSTGEAIADASTHTITMADGTSDEARSFYLKCTGGGQACTVTLAPNTLSKVWLIENTTSYTLTFSQGSGANIAVAAGQVKMIATDGAGSGAAVYDLFTDLSVAGDLLVANTIQPAGDTASGDAAAIGYTGAEGIIITGQGSTSDVTLKNDADGTVFTIPTGTTNVDIVGDVTASTVNADGDTAAGDNAAMGYTAAEGLILTGQGSTNDVTIKNDADADVLTIATGGTNVDVVGDLTAACFIPDGDTSSGDAAAIGYTSAEGLILTGQGSSTDVTIKNDADTTVMSIATGTTQATFAGEVVAASLDISGNIDVDGTTNLDAVDIDGAVQIDNTVTVGVDDTGYDVKFFGDTASAYMLWDASADDLILGGAAGLDVDGTTNLDAVDIDGAVQIDNTLSVGVDDTGYDVKFFGATSGKYMEWDESADQLEVVGTTTVDGTLQVKNGATSAGKIEFFEDSDNGTNKVTLIGPASTADITLTLPNSDGDDGQVLTTDGSGVLSFSTVGGAYNTWLVKTSAYTALVGDQIIVNSSSAVTITLPASASAGNTVIVKATGGGTVTLGRNSQKINSTAADGTLLSGSSTQLVFVDASIGFLEI
tara:strand:+ start:1125 stop:3026 length:1902 start_codon:yes stop_codon:yes gene_type:complete